jgi:hypothetical protein
MSTNKTKQGRKYVPLISLFNVIPVVGAISNLLVSEQLTFSSLSLGDDVTSLDRYENSNIIPCSRSPCI